VRVIKQNGQLSKRIIRLIFVFAITILLGMFSWYLYVLNPNPFDGVAIKIAGILVFLYLQYLVGYFNWVSFGFVSLGALSNGIVLALNSGYMPATACSVSIGIYVPIKEANAQFLCDWIFGIVSIGDVLEIIGFILFSVGFMRYLRK
jgi:hypothetical protein